MRNMVFQVIPKLGYDSMRELHREMKAIKAKELNKEIEDGNGGGTAKEIDSQEILAQTNKFNMLNKRIEKQEASNKKWIQK